MYERCVPSLTYMKYLMWNLDSSKPPGPHPLPFLGNTLLFLTDLDKRCHSLIDQYGPIVEVWINGTTEINVIYIVTPSNTHLRRRTSCATRVNLFSSLGF